jgi:hypothetical protein
MLSLLGSLKLSSVRENEKEIMEKIKNDPNRDNILNRDEFPHRVNDT